MNSPQEEIKKAKEILSSSRYLIAFTGAGISVESGIPPFRGPNGLWSRIDPIVFDLDFFLSHPEKTYELVKELYETFSSAQPNPAHYGLAKAEQAGLLKAIITQNIDSLHQRAGSKEVIEFHGNCRRAACLSCGRYQEFTPELLKDIPPLCSECGGLLKPDFVFFGEPIPQSALSRSLEEARTCDTMLIVGTTGLIQPAAQIPFIAKESGASIVEVNPEPSTYTHSITDVFIPLPASQAIPLILGGETS